MITKEQIIDIARDELTPIGWHEEHAKYIDGLDAFAERLVKLCNIPVVMGRLSLSKMKTLSDISSEEFAELVIFIDKKVLGKTKYPHPYGLLHYRDEVIQSVRHIKDGIAKQLRPSRLAPILTEEYLPFFVVKWLQERDFLNAL